MGFQSFRAQQQAITKARQQQQQGFVASDQEYQLLVAACQQDKAHLKAAYPTDHVERNGAKRAVLVKYRSYLQAWMEQGQTTQNEVLVLNTIWAWDAGDYDWFMVLADYAIQTQQIITWTKRNLSTLLADSIVQAANEAFKVDDQSVETVFWWAFDRVFAWPLTAKDIISAHFYKLAAQLKERDGDAGLALDYYRHADALKGDIGVKGKIKELEKQAPRTQPALSESATVLEKPSDHDLREGGAVLGGAP
jgi:hypothetical protein